MFKISTYLTVFATVIFACSTKDQIGVSDHNLSYELMKMQEQGKIDSTLIGIAISSADEQIIRDAIKTCGIIRDNYFISEIERFLLNPNKEIRESAIFALGEIRDTSTINYIAGVLHIEEFRAQLDAIEALGKIGDKRAAPFIIPLFKRHKLGRVTAPDGGYIIYRFSQGISQKRIRKSSLRRDIRDVQACSGFKLA